MASVALFIKESKDYKRVFNEGKKVLSPHFVLYRATGSQQNSRLGITISKAVVPLATGRNRIKRRIREFWRTRKQGSVKNKDCVIVVRKKIGELTNDAFYQEIADIFNKNLS